MHRFFKFVNKNKSFLLQTYKVSVLMAVPPLMLLLAKHPLVSKYDLSSLLVIFCGAAPLSKEIEDEVYKRIGVLAIRQGFGMSEMTLSVLSQDPEHVNFNESNYAISIN